MKSSVDVQCRKTYDYRLRLEKEGKIGRGRHSSPCLMLENAQYANELDSKMGNPLQKHAGVGYSSKLRKIGPRVKIIEQLKKDTEEKRLIVLHKYEMQTSWCLGAWI